MSWTALIKTTIRQLRPRPALRMSSTMSLSQFLTTQKEKYLRAVQDDSSRDWTVVMGNEAGDLDSIASAVAYSWFASTVQHAPTVALIQTPRQDLHLRAENIYAASLAALDPDQRDLLCIDDLPPTPAFPSHKFALVDHNHLLPRYTHDNPAATVVAVIDHHADEGLYHATAHPRIVATPTGSCTSLIAQLLQSAIPDGTLPPDLATLLLCGLLVDTGGLKPGGKAESADRAAAPYLIAHARPAGPHALDSSSGGGGDAGIADLSAALEDAKQRVAHLGTLDLLRRDFKAYTFAAPAPDPAPVRVGLATVPLDLRVWLPREGAQFWTDADAFVAERGLAVLGILNSFHDEHDRKKSGKARHKRQVLFLVRDDGALGDGAEALAARLWAGLEGCAELALERRELAKLEQREESAVGSRRARAYKQGNVKATRKVIAPLVKAIIEGEQTA